MKSKFMKKGEMVETGLKPINAPYTPGSAKVWAAKLSSEFLGTLFLTWMIGFLGVTFGGEKFVTMLAMHSKTTGHEPVMASLWVTLDIIICVVVFVRWSCDINPAVTTYRLLQKQNSLKFGLSKIGVQLLGGLVAGAFLLLTQQISFSVTGFKGDDPYLNVAQLKAYDGFSSVWASLSSDDDPIGKGMAVRYTFAFLGEFVGTFALIYPIFTKSVKSAATRDALLFGIVFLDVAVTISIGSGALNPARSLGTNYIFDATHSTSAGMKMIAPFLIAPICASFALHYGQIFHEEKFTPAWEKFMTLGSVN